MCEDVENDSNQSNIYVRRDELADTKSSTNKKAFEFYSTE